MLSFLRRQSPALGRQLSISEESSQTWASFHMMGVELQLIELTARYDRAASGEEARRIAAEIADLQDDLARTAEHIRSAAPVDEPGPVLHEANKLGLLRPRRRRGGISS